ncbi:D-glycero-beta-D-manno-heptose 1-phosphate adenylyltransferase [Candidatus Peregrinibacteria bacterium CG22_combo_CG10-13_8_21_14_all_44_10]|nr:MAG: D-glycero-beta-D-manno-heptose 1-phosphate adenylyltransferase [Candidatus Peregrinibacteria bacterium CG22_combo_CG10-13_8_21_14_all_44_10]
MRDILRHEGKRVVTTNGSFDILHSGHVKSLEESKEQGDVLIVGINTDASVKRYKGEGRPIIPEADRAYLVAALSCVDYVFLFDEDDPTEFLSKLKPDVHTNSEEYGSDCVEAEALRENNGELYLIKKIPGLSTSAIIDKIKNA